MSAPRAAGPAVRLEAPSTRFHRSWLNGMAEFGDAHIDGSGLSSKPDLDALAEPAAFASFAERLRADALEETERPAGWVPSTTRWIIVEDGCETFAGTINVRHRLTPSLSTLGGHIGISVIPSARRVGCARAALSLAIPLMRQLGIERFLYTAHESNTASQRLVEAVIDSLGLAFEEDVDGAPATRRFWVKVPSA